MYPTQQPTQTPPEGSIPQTKPNYLKTIVFSIIGIILIGVIVFLYLQNQQLKTEVKVTNFTECSAIKGAILQTSYPAVCVLPSGKSFTQQLSDEEKSKLVPPEVTITQPSTSISPDETVEWKTYSNNEFLFKYPEKWIVEGKKISSAKPSIEMWMFGSNDSLYNECMKLDSTIIIGDITVKSFSGITTSEMCSPTNVNLKEKWIVKTGSEGYAPGLQYSYKSGNPESENYFNQILSTFRFTSEN